ncbi:hypothetical protein ACFQJ7_06065 [Halovenus rubra]|uniref:Uncharacterized protein n=2 Tax=Halovenus rubra TaxID=869890 RepID=A0ACC7E549_9EURY|nr:hypothetical protein [Halovenus rubra]
MSSVEAPRDILSDPHDIRESVADERLDIVWAISLWYNGVPIQHGSKTYYIGRDKPPSLKTLLGCSESEWEQSYKPIFYNLKKDGAFRESTILRRKVEWAPDASLIELTGELFSDHLVDLIQPWSAFNSRKGHIGDWNELLVHRTGVALAASLYLDSGWEPVCYPEISREMTPDLYAYRSDLVEKHKKSPRWGGEVITAHNDREMLERKYNGFAEDKRTSALWIFENRAQAAKAINYLSETSDVDCSIKNTPVNTSGQYSTQVLNKYIKKSKRKNQFCCSGMDRVFTITSIHDSKLNDVTRHNPADIPGSSRYIINSELGKIQNIA